MSKIYSQILSGVRSDNDRAFGSAFKAHGGANAVSEVARSAGGTSRPSALSLGTAGGSLYGAL
jgi:hypothetical protein